MDFNALMRGERAPTPAIPIPAEPKIDDEMITLEYIIKFKPKPKIVREFMRANLAQIPSAEQELFEIKPDLQTKKK